MYTMMIVEDEEIIRKGLVNTIDWNELGFRVIADAEDGDQALQFFHKYNPDVLLIDIKIPMLDGLELLNEIKRADPEKEAVLLSGYEDFAYAKKGIEYKAYAYILKLDMYNEIKQVFSKLYRTLEERNSSKKRIRQLQSYNLFRQACKNFKSLNEDSAFTAQGNFCVLVLWMAKQADILDSLTPDAAAGDASFICTNGNYTILLYSGGRDANEFRKLVSKKALGILDLLKAEEVNTYALGIGEIKSTGDQISQSYNEAMKAVDWGRIHSEKSRHEYNQLLPLLEDRGKVIDWSAIEICIQLNKKTELVSIINEEFYNSIHSSNAHISDLQLLCNEILIRFSMVLDDLGLREDLRDYITGLINKSHEMDSHIDLNDWIIHQVSYLCDKIELHKKNTYINDLQRALSIIDRKFNLNLKLEDIANYIYMTPSYFSVKFKELTGKSFSEYIKTKRIEKACELLVTSKVKIQEISKQVGYEDVKYLSKVFKGTTGLSPHDYRKQKSII